MQRPLTLSARFQHVVVPNSVRFRPRPAKGLGASSRSGLTSEPLPVCDEESSFCRWLLARAGLPAGAYREETLKRRLPACLRALRVRRVEDARGVLEDSPKLVPLAVGAILIGVTSFFRDQQVFDALRRELALLLDKCGALQVWSAGCSEGQELVSVALLIAEIGGLAALERCYLLGTDCRAAAIERARSGVFSAEDMKSVPRALRARYFAQVGDGYALSRAVTPNLRFHTGDLLSETEHGSWDVILCRNTLMYFEARALATLRLWERLESSLRPGGLLVLGKAERPHAAKRLSTIGPCVYRRGRA